MGYKGTSITCNGRKELLYAEVTGFLCSRKLPAAKILQTYDWAVKQKDEGNVVMSGFHSEIEKDVLKYLAMGKQGIIIVLARAMYKKIPGHLQKLLDTDRLLIISPFGEKESRPTKETAYLRNKYIIENSDKLFIPHIRPGGQLERLINNLRYSPDGIPIKVKML